MSFQNALVPLQVLHDVRYFAFSPSAGEHTVSIRWEFLSLAPFSASLLRVADTVPEIRGVIVGGEGRGKGSGPGFPLANPWAGRAFSILKALPFSSGTKGLGEIGAMFVSLWNPTLLPPHRQRHLRNPLREKIQKIRHGSVVACLAIALFCYKIYLLKKHTSDFLSNHYFLVVKSNHSEAKQKSTLP